MKFYIALLGLIILPLATIKAQNEAAIPLAGFNYQAVAVNINDTESFGVDSKGEILVNRPINVRFSILQESETGPAVYQESHATQTDTFGMFRLVVGRGEQTIGGYLHELSWGVVAYFLMVEIDLGSGYQLMGVEELLGAPYALGAGKQLLALDGDILSISDGNAIVLPDNNPANELIQSVTLNGNLLEITEANNLFVVDLTEVLGDDALDNDEIQDLSLNGHILTITRHNNPTQIDLSPYLDDTRLTEAEVDAFVANNGYLLEEIDGSVTNEIQDLSLTGNILNITGGQGVDLSPIIQTVGSDDQNLILTGDVLSIENGAGSVDLNNYRDDADADPTNEIQDLSLNGSQITITHNPNATPIDISGLGGAFSTTNNITSNAPGDYANDSFVFGSLTLDFDGDNNHINRMFFDKTTGSLRAGYSNGTEWDLANRGSFSAAFGVNNIASGVSSFASGELNQSTGMSSSSFGVNNQATGSFSVAAGNSNIASGPFSLALGFNNTSQGTYSTALGHQAFAIGENSLAHGFNAYSDGTNAIALGEGASVLSSNNSVAIGYSSYIDGETYAIHERNIAIGTNANIGAQGSTGSITDAIAIGHYANADGNRSVSIGNASSALGNDSFIAGLHTRGWSYGETVLGMYNLDDVQGNKSTYVDTDKLFSIGNGTGNDLANRSDALVMLKNGNTTLHGNLTIDADNVNGIGTPYTLPGQDGAANQSMVTDGAGNVSWADVDASTTNEIQDLNLNTTTHMLTITNNAAATNIDLSPYESVFATTSGVTSNENGNYATDNFAFGSPNLDYIFGTSIYARSMSFNKSKGSFRAGHHLHNGHGSTVGSYSVAFGAGNVASGTGSAAFGSLSIASGSNSFASGSSNSTASGVSSASFGIGPHAAGNYSLATGAHTRANSYGETALGIFNIDAGGNGLVSVSTDRLFSIGNGVNNLNRSDALVMLKNGNTTLHGNLTIDADNVGGAGTPYTLPGQDGAANQSMVTDGAGNVSWTDVDASSTNEIQDLNLAGNTLTITNNAAATNIDLSAYENVFETTNNVTSNENGDYATDDFVFGSPQISSNGQSEHHNRMFFDKSKAAFMVGRVHGNQADDVNVGLYSINLGVNNTASGDFAIAIGSGNTSSALYSNAFGSSTISSGHSSFTAGLNTQATASFSTAIGFQTVASNIASMATGNETVALGYNSFSGGYQSSAIGGSSFALGYRVTAQSIGEFAIGLYNTNYLPQSGGNTFEPGDRLFVLGNGQDDTNRSDALVMLKNGNTSLHGLLTIDADNVNGAGEEYTLPGQDGAANQTMVTDGAGNVSWTDVDASSTNEIQDLNLAGNTLTITNNAAATNIDLSAYENVFETTNNVTSNENGDYATDDFVFGSPQLADDGNPAHRNRIFFDKSKAAFRVGRVLANQWDPANVGDFSIAMGHSSRASGEHSIALGPGSIASGNNSFAAMGGNAIGDPSIAIGGAAIASNFSLAIGYGAQALEFYSGAMGFGSTATEQGAYALGWGAESTAEGSIAIGTESKAYGINSIAGPHAETNGASDIAIGYLSQTGAGGSSIALGRQSAANGMQSVAIGRHNISNSFGETVLGLYATSGVLPYSPITWQAQDRLFVLGNGLNNASRSDALVMLKNGNTTLHGNLTIDADNVGGADGYTLPGQDGANGQLLVTDGAGQSSWSNDLFGSYNISGDLTVGGVINNPSDSRWKQNISPIDKGLENITKLQGVQYNWNSLKSADTLSLQTGLIAQELEKVLPELVTTDANGYKSVNYTGLIPHLIEAIKALKEENEVLKEQQAQSTAQQQGLEQKMERLEKLIQGIIDQR